MRTRPILALLLATASQAFAAWTYDSAAQTLTQGGVVLENVTASGTKLTIGNNKTNTTATDLDFSTGVEGGYSVTQIAQDAFNGNTSVTSLVLPDTLTWIGQSAFISCSNLGGELVLPDSLTSTGYHSFMGTAVTRVVFGSGMKTVNNWLFRNCTALESVKWNQCITSFGETSFYGCTGLTTFENEFPTNVTSIGGSAFYNCSALTGDNLDLVLMKLTSLGGTAFQNSGIRSIEIGGGLKSTGNAFFLCKKLESMVLHEGTTTIGSDSLPYCTSLTNLVLPASISSIGNSREMGGAHLHVYWCGAPADLTPFTGGNCAVIDKKNPVTHHLEYDDRADWEAAVANGFGNASATLVLPATVFGKGTWGWNGAHTVVWWRTPVAQIGETTYKRLADAVVAANGSTITLLPPNVAEYTDERISLGKGQWFVVPDDPGHLLGYEPYVDPAGGWKLSVSHQTLGGIDVIVYKATGPGTMVLVR